jgi:MHS family proline/betaine transporter-like MFS transporter
VSEAAVVTGSQEAGTRQVIDLKASRKALTAGSLGHMVEWYEFAIYAYMAPIIAPLFFPSESATASLLSTFLLFALAFFLRPLGAVIFGLLTDRIGRRPVLVLIIGMMTLATTLIGLLPTAASIGIWAPILLTVLRVFQGLSAGGEVGGAVSLVVESAPDGRRGVYGAWSFGVQTLAYVLGGGVATLLALTLSPEALTDWGWRVGFLLAAPMGLVVMYLRWNVEETPHFKRVQAERAAAVAPAPTSAASRSLPYLAATLFTVVVYNAIGNTFMVGMPSFLSSSYDMSFFRAYLLALITGAIAGLSMPVFGALSDRVGRWPVLLSGTAGVVVLSYPLYWMISQGFTGGLVALTVAGLLIGVVGGPMPAFLSERFPTRRRASGLSITYAVSVAVFGGTAPYIILWLADVTGDSLSAAYYTLACGVVSLVGLFMVGRSQRNDHVGGLQD